MLCPHSEFITCILAYQDCGAGVNFGMCVPNFFQNMLRVCFILFPSPMEAAQPGAVPGEEEAPQKRIKVEVEEGMMPTKPEPSSAGDVELSGEVHTILINGFPSASGSCATSARWYARSATSCQQGLCPFKNNVNSIGILTQKLNSK